MIAPDVVPSHFQRWESEAQLRCWCIGGWGIRQSVQVGRARYANSDFSVVIIADARMKSRGVAELVKLINRCKLNISARDIKGMAELKLRICLWQ